MGDSKKPDMKKPVVKTIPKMKPKSQVKNILSNIIVSEIGTIKQYIIYDVLIPEFKSTVSTILKGSIDMLFHGEVRKTDKKSKYNKISYSDYYDRGGKRDRYSSGYRDHDRGYGRDVMTVEDIPFETRDDAMAVLDRMDETIDMYGVVSVSDVFQAAGVTGNGFTDNNYGWTSLKTADVERDRDGCYRIVISRPANISSR